MARKIDPAKRHAILVAARSVLLRDGYDAAKMSDIAAEAGVAPGTLYLYFASKETLASAIGEDLFARLNSEFVQVLAEVERNNLVRRLVDWTMRIAIEERELLRLLKQQHAEECEQTDAHAPKRIFHMQLSQALKKLMDSRGVRQYDADALARVVMSVLSGLMLASVYEQPAAAEGMKSTAILVLEHALFEDTTVPNMGTAPVLKR